MAEVGRAQAELHEALQDIFGPGLTGVNGFGAGLDHVTREMALTVTVDSAASARRAASLPDTIQGLPVKVARRGAARAG